MNTAEVLVIGVRDVSAEKQLNDCRAWGLDQDEIQIQHLQQLPDVSDMENMPAPIVVLLGCSDESVRQMEQIRQHWGYTSVIVCGEHDRLPEIHQLLAKGASDFLELPVKSEEFTRRVTARVGAYAHRSRESTRQLGGLTVNIMQRTVSNGRDTAFLTPIETRIVAALAESVGGVVERAAMKQMCWGDMSITDNALNRKIYEVRRTLRKLSEDVNIRTIYGLGFELETSDRNR